MWAKDYYQEQMLGYLDWMQTELERLERSSVRHNDLDELYDDLDVAIERLWRLIGSTEVDWERFRHPLEVSCDTLLRTFNHMPHTASLLFAVTLASTENFDRRPLVLKPVNLSK